MMSIRFALRQPQSDKRVNKKFDALFMDNVYLKDSIKQDWKSFESYTAVKTVMN